MLEPAAMAPVARTELDLAATCRNCGQALAAGRAICQNCGAAHGAANRCPHCDAVADVERHAALGFRCLVCGGPRIALDIQGVEPSVRTNEALRSAGREQTQHVMFSAAGFALVGMGTLAVLVATLAVLATSPGALLAVAAYAASAVPLVTGAFALSRAAKARKNRGDAILRARVSALGDVQAVTGVLPAPRVTEVLRLSTEAAELVLAEASIASYLNEGPAPRVRVEEPDRAPEAEEAPPNEATAHSPVAQRGKTES